MSTALFDAAKDLSRHRGLVPIAREDMVALVTGRLDLRMPEGYRVVDIFEDRLHERFFVIIVAPGLQEVVAGAESPTLLTRLDVERRGNYLHRTVTVQEDTFA